MQATLTTQTPNPTYSANNWQLRRPLSRPSDDVRNYLADPINYRGERPSFAYLDFSSDADKILLKKAIKKDPNCLAGAQFIYSNLAGVDLSGAILKNTNFFQARLNSADLSRAYLVGSNFSGTNLRGAKINNVPSLKFANLIGAVINGATQLPADFSAQNFVKLGGRLSWSTNSQPSDTQAAWKEGQLRTLLPDKVLAFLRNPENHLEERPSLAHFDFSAGKANKELTQALNANPLLLCNADLKWADLTNLDLSKVDLSGADLRGANLTAEQLRVIIFDKKTKLPGNIKAAKTFPKNDTIPANYGFNPEQNSFIITIDPTSASEKNIKFAKKSIPLAKKENQSFWGIPVIKFIYRTLEATANHLLERIVRSR
jgi:uncharacterized protein YjbI with pentapeptide repeats